MSDNENEKKAEAIFEATIDLPTADRPAAIAAACGGDAALAARVRALHEGARAAGGFLSDPTVDAAPVTERPGSVIGRYKLLQQIGEGGFGVVFMAEQEKPVRRTVALKVIKLGMDTREVVTRFEAERQALAMMDHPNIAKVLDAGSTDTGRPYFVMELVRGSSITEYCDKHRLDAAGRIALLAQVCRAVQHAHSKGVIHRDIKPSNVLVTVIDDKPVPKVIDFGIAKATQSRLTEQTLFTAFRQLIGTPQYMSPEQADSDGTDVDTRTDVYSLGVLLYELLVGTTPFDAKSLRSAAYDEMRRIIREDEPDKPSTRLGTLGVTLATVATNRGTNAKHLSHLVRGELDWIVMRAVEKERARRYETAAALADDLDRYLTGEPVAAGPPGGVYRLKKLARRHKAAIGVAAAVGIVLLLGIAGTSVGLVREARMRRVAEVQRTKAEKAEARARQQQAVAESRQDDEQAVMTFMTQDVFGQSAQRSAGKALSAPLADLLAGPAATAAGRRFKDKPLILAAVRQNLADTLLAVGQPALARPLAEASLEARRTLLSELDPATLSSMDTQARVLTALGDLVNAEPLARTAWEHRPRNDGPDDLTILACGYNYGSILAAKVPPDAAVPVLKEVSEGYRLTLGTVDVRTLQAQCLYGQMLAAVGRPEDAAPILIETWWEARRVLGYGNPTAMTALSQSASLLVSLHRDPDAESFCKWVLEWRQMSKGPTDPATIAALDAYTTVLWRRSRYDVAQPLFTRLADALALTKPETDPAVMTARARAKECARLKDKSRPSDLEAANHQADWQYDAALADARQAGQPGHDFGRLTEDSEWADGYLHSHDWLGAAQLYEVVIDARHRQVPPDASALVNDLFNLSRALTQLHRLPEAVDRLKEALEVERKQLGPGDPATVAYASQLAQALDAVGNATQAAAVRAEYGVTTPATTRPTNRPPPKN